MAMRSKIVIGLIIVSLSMITVAGISFAADNSPSGGTAKSFVYGCRGFAGSALDTIAKLLGLKPEQVIEKRKAGESLADIAKDQKVSKSKLVDTIIDARKKVLDERVKAGVITQAQEDAILKAMRARVEQRIQNKAVGPGCGGYRQGLGQGFGRGGCGGGCGGGFGPGAGLGTSGGVRNAPATGAL